MVDPNSSATFAREIWLRLETLHAVTYFAPEPLEASSELGLTGFWRGYFAFRAAPLGVTSAGVVEAAFANFEPAFVAKRVPSIWSVTTPDAAIDARSRSAAATLRRLVRDIDSVAVSVSPSLERVIDEAASLGRPLFAANRDVPLAADPVEQLWQRCTVLREHRGDGHVAALAAAGIDGCEAHVLIAAERGTDPVDLQQTRGWSEDQWAAAVARLVDRGLIDGATPQQAGHLTETGIAVRAEVEATTDRLAGVPYDALSDTEQAALWDLVDEPARTVAASGTIRFPNPMGLPQVT